jgi:hypothetical protein
MFDQSGLPEPIEAISDGEQFALLKCGGGSVYALRCREEKTVALFKDDGLVSFLAQPWDQGGYSAVAVPDEGGNSPLRRGPPGLARGGR